MPVPRVAIAIRPGIASDFEFIDALQKEHRNQVGFMMRPLVEEYLSRGEALIAEDATGAAIGYVIARDRYFRRDDVGVIYQLNVAPTNQRKLIGAALVKAVFERAAYGCKLFCCWCAQDIAANRFWEAMHFTPLAFRAGSKGKKRIHIFWQRRIRAGDGETPYWYPCATNAGAIKQDRIVFPIPPGRHWSDAMPIVLPEARAGVSPGTIPEGDAKRLPSKRKTLKAKRVVWNRRSVSLGGLWFAPVKSAESGSPSPSPVVVERDAKKLRTSNPRPRMKNDPRHVAMARELRDRYLEQVNSGAIELPCNGKYDVRRRMEAPSPLTPLPPPDPGMGEGKCLPLLNAA